MEAQKLNKMAALLLEMAADTFSNHGCNDLDPQFIDAIGLTEEDKREIVSDFYKWNGNFEEAEKSGWITASGFDGLGDSTLMSFVAYRLAGSFRSAQSMVGDPK
jgi:hypothetical protein